MNRTLIVAFWRQRLASPFRLALLAFVVGMPLLMVLALPQTGLAPLGDMTAIVLIVAAGAIGQDVSSGVLQLLLARPVRRSDYVLSRWTAASLAAAALGLLQLAVAYALLAMRGAPPAPDAVLILAGERVIASAGICAVVVLLSSLVGGIGDVGLWLVGTVTGLLVGSVGPAFGAPWLGRVGQEIQVTFSPKVGLAFLAGGGSVPWYAIAATLSTVVLCLALAIVAVNRKELSYASG